MNGDPRPLVSIVIPCFNQAQYLGSSIASARAQSYIPLEVIVVDDGSTDHTAAVASASGATMIRTTHSGVSHARNAGLRAARGEFVLFLDADDELLPDAVDIGVRALTAAPSGACAVGRTRPIDVDGRDLAAPPPRAPVSDLYRAWLSENFVFTPGAALFRRLPFCGVGGFPEDVGPAADYAVYLELARTGRVVDHGQVVVRYRSHPASMSRDSSRMLRATMRVLEKERPQLPVGYEADFRRGRSRWARWYGEQLIEWIREDARVRGARLEHFRGLAMLCRYCPGLLLSRMRSRVTRALVAVGASHGRKFE